MNRRIPGDLISRLRDVDDVEVFADRFEIEREAGVGGMGIVYRAHDRTDGRTVALKILREVDASGLRRFTREAETLRSLDDPAIVTYFAHGLSADDEPWLAMEWVEGESLSSVLRSRAADGVWALALGETLVLGRALARALAASHALGIVHRDIKPDNVHLVDGRLDRPKLVDFGIARPPTMPAHRLTATGQVLGTVGYMAPEHAAGADDLDGRADLFSLGCLLHRCLADVDPFEGPRALTVLAKSVLFDAPRVRLARPEVPEALDDLVARLLAKDRAGRPASAERVERELERIEASLDHDPLSSRARSRIETGPPDAARSGSDQPSGSTRVVLAVSMILAFSTAPQSRPLDASAPMPIVSLPISTTCSAVATDTYRRGLEALRDASESRARRFFERASDVDPMCAEARLRAGHEASPGLSPRDRVIQEVLGEPDAVRAVDILDAAVMQYPGDAELLLLSATRRLDLPLDERTLAEAHRRCKRALAIDPRYAAAWEVEARIAVRENDADAALGALATCLDVQQGAVDCMKDRIHVLRGRDRNVEASAQARRWISWEPSADAYRELSSSLRAEGAPPDAVDEALRLAEAGGS